MLPIDSKELHFHYKSETEPQDLDVSHCHDKYEILYVVEGTARCVIEDRELSVGEGDVIVIRPFQYHLLVLEPGIKYERFVVQFRHASLYPETARLLDSMLRSHDGEDSSFFVTQATSSIADIFWRFDTARTLPDSECYTYMRMLVSQIIILLSVSVSEDTMRESGDLGERVIRYLNTNIDRDVSLDALAKHFFVSKYHLCRAFKRRNGISVHGYVNRKRVLYAKQLIESGETASGAAYRVGFGDYSAFYRAYVRIVGHSPIADADRRAQKSDEGESNELRAP